jgi:hypothetical protein
VKNKRGDVKYELIDSDKEKHKKPKTVKVLKRIDDSEELIHRKAAGVGRDSVSFTGNRDVFHVLNPKD